MTSHRASVTIPARERRYGPRPTQGPPAPPLEERRTKSCCGSDGEAARGTHSLLARRRWYTGRSGRALSGAGAEGGRGSPSAHGADPDRGLGRSGRTGLAVSATAHGRGKPGCGGAAGVRRRGARTAATDQ